MIDLKTFSVVLWVSVQYLCLFYVYLSFSNWANCFNFLEYSCISTAFIPHSPPPSPPSYEVMRSCWDKEPTRRPGFRELGQTLKGLLSELPVLEASQEASYINQVLEVAAAAAASQDPQSDSGGRWENVYLPTPVGAAAAREEEAEVEDGYLKCLTGSAVKGDNNH